MEIWIAEEVVKAGEEAYDECEQKRLDRRNTVLEVYLAMQGVQLLLEARYATKH